MKWKAYKNKKPKKMLKKYLVSDGSSIDMDVWDGIEFIKFDKQVKYWILLKSPNEL